MQTPVTRLFPAPQQELPLEGLYLEHDLYGRGKPGKPFVYSNFITSLDGRIAIAAAGRTSHMVPPLTANSRDWRLYQELAGQADLLVTSGRFFRQSLQGEAQDQLPLGSQTAFADIHAWRTARGMKPQPDLAIMSGSLDIPLAALEPYRSRRIIVMTGERAEPGRMANLEDEGIEVVRAGNGHAVDGRLMLAALARRDYRSVYAIAGPAVFHSLIRAHVVDRLYLTIALQLLGGDQYDTLSKGDILDPVQGMRMVGLYHDTGAPANASQLFGIFEPLSRA